MNVLTIPWWIKYLELGSQIDEVVIHLYPHVGIIQDLISGEQPLFTDS